MISDTIVECYSGHVYAQEPRAFWLDNQRRSVITVRRRWREPTGPCFEVLADDAETYLVAYNETTDCWSISAKADCSGHCSCPNLRQITLSKEGGQ